MLQMTPFYQFLMPFINKAVNRKHIKGTKNGMINILDSYDKNQQVFMVAGKKLTISAPEFEMIFGIASGSIDIDMKNSSVGEHSLGNYTFSEHNLITPKHLKEQIMKAVTRTEPRDTENSVRMMILHVVACVSLSPTLMLSVGGCCAYAKTCTVQHVLWDIICSNI